MCGIVGMLHGGGQPASPTILKKMADLIRHRGPDGEGFFSDGAFGVGHRRLAILDLSEAGHQPMLSRDNRYVLSYNGEVYNFRELRLELEALGHRFHSQTDTEVVLNAISQWGEGALKRLNGMFAFALWDREKKELWLARDRYGIKPLYYTLVGKQLLFGSEVKAFRADPDFKTEMDHEALLEYMTFQNFFSTRTLFKGVVTLPPGTFWRIPAGFQDRLPEPQSYWDFDFHQSEKDIDERECVEELNRLIVQAVNRQLVSDVEVGSYLSGGVDSGCVTAIAARQLENLKTFTVGFDLNSAAGLELSFDERSRAEHMSYLFGTEQYEMVLKAGDMERILPRLVWHLDEPRVGQSYPNFYAAQLASKFTKVVLSGTGGDELFAGYPWRYYRASGESTFSDYTDHYYNFWQRLSSAEELERMLAPLWKELRHISTRDIFQSVFSNSRPVPKTSEDYVNESLYFEAKTFLHGLLIVEDKLSMASSLETRIPFLDNDVVDFAQRVPVSLKLGDLSSFAKVDEHSLSDKKAARVFVRSSEGKRVLRQAMGKHVPAEVAERAKQGFSAPDSSWFKGESMQYVRKVVENKNAPLYDYFDQKAVLAAVNLHLEGKQNRRLLIWSILSINQWLAEFG